MELCLHSTPTTSYHGLVLQHAAATANCFRQRTVSNMRLDTCKYLAKVGGSTKSNRDAGYSEYYHCFSQSLKVKTDKTLHQPTTASFHISSNSLLGAFAYSPKTHICFVCLSTRISSAPNERTSVGSETGAFYENLNSVKTWHFTFGRQ